MVPISIRCSYLRKQGNILKRQLIHLGAFNLSLVMRQMLGVGTPRELESRVIQLVLLIFRLITCPNRLNNAVALSTPPVLDSTGTYRSIKPRCRAFWKSTTCTTDCYDGAVRTVLSA